MNNVLQVRGFFFLIVPKGMIQLHNFCNPNTTEKREDCKKKTQRHHHFKWLWFPKKIAENFLAQSFYSFFFLHYPVFLLFGWHSLCFDTIPFSLFIHCFCCLCVCVFFFRATIALVVVWHHHGKWEMAKEQKWRQSIFVGDCFPHSKRLCSLIYFAFMLRIRRTVVECNSFDVCEHQSHNTHTNKPKWERENGSILPKEKDGCCIV